MSYFGESVGGRLLDDKRTSSLGIWPGIIYYIGPQRNVLSLAVGWGRGWGGSDFKVLCGPGVIREVRVNRYKDLKVGCVDPYRE